MIIIKFRGGLGNQLFQYALYEKFRSLGRRTYADLTDIHNMDIKGYPKNQWSIAESARIGLKKLNISVEELHNDRLLKKYSERDLPGKLRHRLLKKNRWRYTEDRTRLGEYQGEIFCLEDVYLEGSWQTEKYFYDIKDIIVDKIHFSPSGTPENHEVETLICDQNSVSVHIRRGDYTNSSVIDLYGGISTPQYYNNAIDYIQRKCENPYFVFFTYDGENDIPWIKANIRLEGLQYTIVDWNTGAECYFDMYLMTQCRHNIIAHSSFSWWGAWLNQNKNRIVIAPDKWLNNMGMPDIVCEGWIRLPG